MGTEAVLLSRPGEIMERESKTTVVLYPGVGVGNLYPMLELSNGILRHSGDAVDVAVVLVESPFGDDPGFSAAVARARASYSNVSFHVLPAPPLPASVPISAGGDEDHRVVGLLRYLRAMNAPLRDLLRSLLSSSPASRHALVLDMFCAPALNVAAELGIPAYFFFATGATALAVFLALPGARARACGASFAALGDLTFAGVPPLKATDLPPGLAGDGGSALCHFTLRLAERVPDARGMLVNSFEALEPRAVQALRDGLCVHGRPTPPLYCVGPLVSPAAGDGDDDRHECLRWMDKQPDSSVVFLCFGNLSTFPRTQLAEIATGLERSGQRFLWVVRRPPGEQSDDLDDLLPAGFRHRTSDKGLVVASWVPQVDVLRHRAAGTFVTHCGWNSTLEGVAAGLPLLCWPLYAEQGLNKVFVVEEMRLGVEMKKSHCAGEVVVTAEEVEAKVRWVMGDSDGARELRERAAAARGKVAQALTDGGPSQAAFVAFVKDLKQGVGLNYQSMEPEVEAGPYPQLSAVACP